MPASFQTLELAPMDKLKNKISLVKSRLAELIARKESAPVRLELYRIARDVDELLGPPISDQLEHVSPTHDYQAMHRIHPRTHRNLILVVDEDEAARQYLTVPLSKEFDVAEARDGGEAWEMALELNPDIIISDMMTSIIPGDQLCRKLRGNVETSHIAIILLSALSEREDIIYGLEAGADDYIAKPCDIDILRTRILSLLKRSRHLRQEARSMQGHTELMEFKSQLDRDFMHRVFRIIESQLSNADFSIGDLCCELAMSRSSVYNKLKTLTGRGPNDIIKIVRLSKARDLLTRRPWPIADVSAMVGFSDPKYFSTCFKKEYGISPSKLNDETQQDT